MKKVIALLAGLAASTTVAIATPADGCSSWGCQGVIQTLYIDPANNLIAVGTPFDEKQADCTPVSGVFLTYPMDKAHSDKLYSALLAGYTAQKKMQISVKKNAANECEIHRVEFHNYL